jgi:hypothetical protein
MWGWENGDESFNYFQQINHSFSAEASEETVSIGGSYGRNGIDFRPKT